jgi:prepilin-type N-terminal cleavage/methylation domain-containing protein
MASGRNRARGLPPRAGGSGLPVAPAGTRAFTLIEVMVVMGLTVILMVAGMGALLSMNLCTRRMADYNAALAVVTAKIQDIRAATYNPPNSPWTSSTVNLTNSGSIALNQAGVTFQVPGKVVSTITPVASGHLVTVTGTFNEPSRALTVSLQTLVNKFSAGQQ